MNRCLLLLALFALPGVTIAASLNCATDANTDQHMCFPDGPMRTSTDKVVREAALYSGGPRGATATGHTVRVFCSAKFVPVLEMRDRKGVVFARNQPEAKIGRDFAQAMCTHSPLRTDKALDKAERF